METGYCTRCQLNSEGDLLRELARSGDRSLDDLVKQSQRRQDSFLGQESRKHMDERTQDERARLEQYEEELRQYEENASYQAMDSILQGESLDEIEQRILGDALARELEKKVRALKWKSEEVSEGDIRQVLEEYERQGYIDIEEGKINITSRGAGRLASNALERILNSLKSKKLGEHSVDKTGFGSELTAYTRKYEVGDDYSLVNIERTIMNTLERAGTLEFEPNDFEIHEEVHQTSLCAGLIVDESGSMRSHHKLEAAIETSLALSELIAREPKDSLKVFLFSEKVKEIPPWTIINEVVSGGSTDILAAMQAFRKSVVNEKGDKQAYLITDTEPNTENGKYVGFDQAITGVMTEAARFRQQNIGLNIVMLDENPRLKQLASALAKRNLGRVFFTTPMRLGEAIIEDYLNTRRERV
ncbi:VWA domain-containing protein [Chloroflexota bacterium]